jgi:Protein of unknown function (DUF2815)
MKVLLKNVRLAFPALFEAKAIAGSDKAKFSAAFLLPPGHPSMADMRAAIAAVSKDKWAAKAAVNLKAIETANKTCLHDGNTKADYDGYADNFFVNASSDARPMVLHADKTPLTAKDGKPYAGCYVNATVDVWAMDNTYGKRVNATLLGVQFARDGDSFAAGAVGSEDDFDDVASGADASDLV